MKKTCLACLFAGLVALAACAQVADVSVPNAFASNNPISASQMNANFAALVQAIKNDIVPRGSIIASVIAPDATSDYMLGDVNKVWAFADGSKPADVTGYAWAFPDLRGQFLRGMNQGATVDPQPGRTAGVTVQADAFQEHAHNWRNPSQLWSASHEGSGTAPGSDANTILNSLGAMTIVAIVPNDINRVPRVATETRPTNLAVYWYVKVR